MFRIIRNASQFTIELTVDGRKFVKDVSDLKANQRAKLAARLFRWHREGAVGFPNLEV